MSSAVIQLPPSSRISGIESCLSFIPVEGDSLPKLDKKDDKKINKSERYWKPKAYPSFEEIATLDKTSFDEGFKVFSDLPTTTTPGLKIPKVPCPLFDKVSSYQPYSNTAKPWKIKFDIVEGENGKRTTG